MKLQKILVLFFIIFLVLGNCNETNSSQEASTNQLSLSKEINHNIEAYKNVANIIFFLTMSIIGILSYLQARKTVFSPIKTEVFKYQLQAYEKIIEYFQNKKETELLNDLDIQMIIEINAFNLYKDYVTTCIDSSTQMNPKYTDKYRQLSTRVKLVKGTHFDYFDEINYSDTNTEENKKRSVEWNDKEYEMIFYTDTNYNTTEKIKSFQNSPLVPLELKKLLDEYLMLADECLNTVGAVIEEVGKDMPNTFPTKNKLKNFNTYGLFNLFSNKRPALEPKAKEILTYINKYLNVEKVVEHGA